MLQVVLGMPHRGRLNVLCTLLGKQPGLLFAEMDNAQSRWHVGDVPFHLGQSAELSFPQPVRPSPPPPGVQPPRQRQPGAHLMPDACGRRVTC